MESPREIAARQTGTLPFCALLEGTSVDESRAPCLGLIRKRKHCTHICSHAHSFLFTSTHEPLHASTFPNLNCKHSQITLPTPLPSPLPVHTARNTQHVAPLFAERAGSCGAGKGCHHHHPHPISCLEVRGFPFTFPKPRGALFKVCVRVWCAQNHRCLFVWRRECERREGREGEGEGREGIWECVQWFKFGMFDV